MKKLFKNLFITAVAVATIFGYSSCGKDEGTDAKPQLGTVENIVLSDVSNGVNVIWDAYTGAKSYMVTIAGIPDSDLPIASNSYTIEGSLVDGVEVKVLAYSDSQTTTLIAEGTANYSEGGDNGGSGDTNGTIDVKTENVVGRWESNRNYYIFTENGKGESGTVANEVFGDEEAKEDDITWEITTFDVMVIDTVTLEISEVEKAGVKVTGSDGYFFELIASMKGDTLVLTDETNYETYNKIIVHTEAEDPTFRSVTLPGIIEAENYNNGGEGVAYHDKDSKNEGGEYRFGGVDIGKIGENGLSVGWTEEGEWLKYKVFVNTSGLYHMKVVSAAGGNSAGKIKVTIGSTDVEADLPHTRSWDKYDTVQTIPFQLSEGQQELTISILKAGSNLDKIELIEGGIYSKEDFNAIDFDGYYLGNSYRLYCQSGTVDFSKGGDNVRFGENWEIAFLDFSDNHGNSFKGETIVGKAYDAANQIVEYKFFINSKTEIVYYNDKEDDGVPVLITMTQMLK